VCSARPFDASRSAASQEGLIEAYPESPERQDALEVLLVSYCHPGAPEKLVSTAEHLLETNAASLPALALLAYVGRMNLNRVQKSRQSKMNDAAFHAESGFEVVKETLQDKCGGKETHCRSQSIQRTKLKRRLRRLNGITSVLLVRHCSLRSHF